MRAPVRFAAPLAVALLAAAAPARAHAQDLSMFIGRPVTTVIVLMEGQLESNPGILALIAVKAGAPFKLEDVATSVSQLVSGAESEEVRVTALETAGGVEIVFHVTPPHPVDDLEFAGDVGLPAEDLDRAVRTRLLRQTTGRTAESARRFVVETLVDEGFQHADAAVEVRLRHEPFHRSTYVFTVTAGTRAVINELTIDNRSSLSNGTVARLTGLVRGGPYRKRAIQAGVAAIRDELREEGFYAARVPYDEAERQPDQWAVSLTIDPGPHVVLRWAQDGDRPPRGDLDDFAPIAQIGSVDDDVLEESRRRIEAALHSEGFKNAQVAYGRDTPAPGRLVVTFKVTRGARFVIHDIQLTERLHFTADQIRTLLRLESGEVRNARAMTEALQRVVDAYELNGFYQVSARLLEQDLPAQANGDVPVVVQLAVAEGPQGIVRRVLFDPAPRGIPESELRSAIATREGQPFRKPLVHADRYVLEGLYRDRGFRLVTIEPEYVLGQAVTVTFKIAEGIQAIVADIQVIGNAQVSERAILEEITLRPGQPFGEAARVESTRRLSRIGVFQRVSITELQRAPGDNRSHVVITVVESPATAVGVGGGLEVDDRTRATASGGSETYLSIAPRGFFEISRRNLGGRNRTLSFFSRVALKPRSTTDDADPSTSGFGFAEYRVTGTYRERRAFRTDTDILFGITLEQAVRTTFNFSHKTLNAEAQRQIGPGLSLTGRYVLDFTELFDEILDEDDKPLIDRRFPQVRLSILSTGVFFDRRNDPINPTRGLLTTADIEFASTRFGSQVGYVKVFAQSSAFRVLGTSGRFVLAVRGQLGLARGFARTVLDENGNPEVIEDLPASQRFFAGGSTSVRGFQIDRLGVVPDVFTESGLPLGGNALVVLNVELRTGIGRLFGRDLALATFADAGNVFKRAGDVDLGRLRGALGFGLRYNSPLGPLRLDLGFKLDRQTLGGRRERGWEYHLNLGQAF